MPQQIECPKCSAVISVSDVDLEPVQGKELSVVVIRHAHEINCPACGVLLVSALATADVQVGWRIAPVPPEASRIILPEILSKHLH